MADTADRGRSDRSWSARISRIDPVLATLALWAAVVGVVLVTYTRIPPEDLYHVSIDGIAGGLSRLVVLVNFPIALVAIATVLISLDRLPHRQRGWGALSIVLCAFTVWPGVVDDGDLDARWVNALPAVGVTIAVVMAVAAARVDRAPIGHLPLDPARWVLGVTAALISIPWIAADFGVYLPGRIFIMESALADDRVGEIAVHYGHHHGFDGALLVVTTVVLSRVRPKGRRMGVAVRAYVALMFAYGMVNMVQDGWNEQLVKRGWFDWWMPSAVHPGLSPIWMVVVGIGAMTFAALTWESRRRALSRRTESPRPAGQSHTTS